MAAIMLFSLGITVFAAQVPENEQGDVFARYANNAVNVPSGIVGDDKTITLPDGTEITVSSDNDEDNGLRIVIILISAEDRDAYDYVSGAVAPFGKEPYAFYVAFYDGDTSVAPKGSIAVTMTLPGSYSRADLYYIGADGNNIAVDYTDENGKIVFLLNNAGYIALVKPVSDNTNPNDTDSTRTGDDGNIWMWGLILTVNLGMLLMVAKRCKSSKL